MALYWDWKEKCGEATLKQMINEKEKEFTISLYTGNAYLIMLMEYEEDGKQMYSMYSFWADRKHMNRCLGLTKGDSNMYEIEWSRITKFRLNKAKCRYWKQIVPALAKAFKSIEIELFTEE